MVTLDLLEDPSVIQTLARRVYEDPANRHATGWMDEEDKEEAIASLVGLWRRRHATGWSVFRVVHDGREVGLAGHGDPSDPEDPPGLGVYLLERGHGIGTEVARRLVERARAAGATSMETVSHAGNQASHRMLERVGFRQTGPCRADWAVESGEPWVVYRWEEEPAQGASGRNA